MDDKKNLELWNSVCETDPKYTNRVAFGKYVFHDIDSTWNIKRATEKWGSFGSTWGLVDFHVTQIYGPGDSGVMGLIVQGTFKYPGGEFDIAADMPYDPKDEVLKKLQTMCIGKALSRLGFSADVYEGRFDDSAYVKEMEEKYARPNDTDSDTSTTVPDTRAKVVANTPKKLAKYPEPDPIASGILGALAQRYMDLIANDEKYAGTMVSFSKVCQAVYNHFGKYPTKVDSIPKLMDAIPITEVLEENDFLRGL
jgi:hypothetical protein